MKAKKIYDLLSRNYFYFTIAILSSAVFFSCAKKVDEVSHQVPSSDSIPSGSPVITLPVGPTLECPNTPDYGDSLLCGDVSVDQNGNNYIVYPINYPGPGLGNYVSFPEGLIIDENTGAINITKSESGMIYRVGYVPTGSSDTCFTKIIIGGITYMDGVHILSENDTIVTPIYNGNPDGKPVCGTNGDFGSCQFDNSNDAGGMDYTCNFQGIKIDPSNGVISLNRSLLAGLFGTLPTNGASIEATLYYRLADCSGMALRIRCSTRKRKLRDINEPKAPAYTSSCKAFILRINN